MTTSVRVINYGPQRVRLKVRDARHDPASPDREQQIGELNAGDVSSAIYVHSTQDVIVEEIK